MGALAIMAGDVAGREIPAALGVPAAARFVDEGDAAGCKPGTSTGGDFCADGNCGWADRATTDESVGASFGFHQAHCGPDWHPMLVVNRVATVSSWAVVVFMATTPAFICRHVVESRVLVRALAHRIAS
jgi:hypothetical protein